MKRSSDLALRHLSPADLAERVNVPLQTVYEWNSKGSGPRYFRVGRHVRYRLADVEAWEARLLVGPPDGGRAA